MMRPSSKSIASNDLDNHNLISEQNLHPIGRRKAVFVDRDGTINVEKGYIIDPSKIELAPLAGVSISSLNGYRIPLIVITNQAAIGKGLLTLETFEKINEKLWNDLQSTNAYYDALYYCPHSPGITADCSCRKPKPGLLFQAARDFGIDLSSSFMIGDKLTDVGAGQAGGCKTVLLLSGYEKSNRQLAFSDNLSRPDFICDTLAEAIEWVLPQILKNDVPEVS